MQYLLALLMFCLTGCCFQSCDDDCCWQAPIGGVVHTEEITNIIQDYQLELETRYRLHLLDANVYYDPYIDTIALKFVSEDIIEMSDARKLIVDVVEGLLAKLNQNIIVGPQFKEYPFSSGDLEIYITFDSFYGRFVDPYYMMWICLEDDIVHYYLFDTKNQDKNTWHYRREAYYKSREIVVYQRDAEQQKDEALQLRRQSAFGPDRYIP